MSNPDTVLNIVDSLRNNDRTLIQYNVLYCCNFSSFAAQLGDESCIVLNTADIPLTSMMIAPDAVQTIVLF